MCTGMQGKGQGKKVLYCTIHNVLSTVLLGQRCFDSLSKHIYLWLGWWQGGIAPNSCYHYSHFLHAFVVSFLLVNVSLVTSIGHCTFFDLLSVALLICKFVRFNGGYDTHCFTSFYSSATLFMTKMTDRNDLAMVCEQSPTVQVL